MKVISVYSSYDKSIEPVTIQDALHTAMSSDAGGQIESIEYQLDNIKHVLSRFMAMYVTSAKELNNVLGYEGYKELDK